MNADGTGEVNLTPGESQPCDGLCYQGHDDSPAWFPDGSRIAYVHTWAENGGGVPNIWTMSPDGSGKANLTDNPDVAFTQPAPSPRGTRIAAIGAVTTDRNLWVMNADGSAQAAIESAPSHETDPDWGVEAAVAAPQRLRLRQGRQEQAQGHRATHPAAAGGRGHSCCGARTSSAGRSPSPAAGTVRVAVVPTGKLKRALRRTGKATARIRVTYTPEGGAARTERTTIRLVRRTG